MIPIWTLLPFVLLLLSIAFSPVVAPHFWESNRNKGIVSFLLAIPILIWLLTHVPEELFHTLREYVAFIFLLGSLYVISGGIALSGDLEGTPKVNVIFLALGAFLASIIGTTGASMVLIRPFLRTNSERVNTSHLPLFFILVVSNCGGLLTPLGDPPLFLGYLRGVPFFWTLRLFPYWVLVNGALLLIFYFWDRRAYHAESAKALRKDRSAVEPLRLEGKRNLFFLGGVLYGVFLPTPWREILMGHMALLSLIIGSKEARRHNRFTWHPIIEIAFLFAGIFITMVPALMFLEKHGSQFGITQPWHFFWTTGSLSSFLDNTPTYVTFLSMAQGLHLSSEVVGVSTKVLEAISLGAVLMGANTYIGNGPNFMVKAIADHSGFKTFSFFRYMAYAVLILSPLYGIITLSLIL